MRATARPALVQRLGLTVSDAWIVAAALTMVSRRRPGPACGIDRVYPFDVDDVRHRCVREPGPTHGNRPRPPPVRSRTRAHPRQPPTPVGRVGQGSARAEGAIAGDGGAMQEPAGAVVVVDGEVEQRTVVPDGEGAR